MSGFELPPGFGPDRLRTAVDWSAHEDGERSTGPKTEGLGSFADVLTEHVGQVQELQGDVQKLYGELAEGKPVPLHDIYIAAGKADVAFTMMMEVRNKLTEAWQVLSRQAI